MTKKKRRCKYCHKLFKISRKHRVYCSIKCHKNNQKILLHQWYIKNKQKILSRGKSNPNKPYAQWKAMIKKKYGLTPEQYNTMLCKQNYACNICRKPTSRKKLAVDHNHKTGKVRGLLCVKCNTLLGFVYDDINILKRAIKHLKYEL